jgi:hypothetical protein
MAFLRMALTYESLLNLELIRWLRVADNFEQMM